MFSSFWGAAKQSPFKGPFTKAQCSSDTTTSSSSMSSLVSGREIAAASATVPASTEDSCEFGSNKYFLLCGIGGILSCGTTHTFVVPLDLVKCRLQVDSAKYKNLFHGFKVTINEEGTRGLAKGWAPTFFGYSAQTIQIWQFTQLSIMCPDKNPKPMMSFYDICISISSFFPKHIRHDTDLIISAFDIESNITFLYYVIKGLCKFGLYEVFKVYYANLLGEENAYLYRTSLYLAASASAEFFADIALAPFEAAKVKIQTMPGYANTFRQAAPKMMKEEGISAFYKGLVPLWCRQIPYTMMKFACFERTVELLYKFVVPKPRAECTKGEQLVVTFAAGYIAGVFCAIVSHPADVVVSKLNQAKGSSAFEVARSLGFFGMWNGLVPRIIMIGTLTALQWFIYDGVKVALRLPRPPPPEMPESLKQKLAAKEQ